MSSLIAKNNTSSAIAVSGYRILNINMTDAEIVDVVNNNNIKFKSYKYSYNNIDYFYVVDGVQREWTDDLASLGYTEIPIVIKLKGWFTSNHVERNVGAGYNTLYDDNGDIIPYISGKIYTLDPEENNSLILQNGSLQDMYSQGKLALYYGSYDSVRLAYITYIVS